MIVSEIQRRIQNAPSLDFSTLFSQSLELFKKVWVQGFIAILLTMVMAIPIILLFYIPLIFMGVIEAFMSSYNGYYDETNLGWLTLLSLFLMYLLAIVALSTIALALKAAFYRICKMKDFEEMGKEDYFYFLRKEYFKKSVLLALSSMGIAFIATLLCFIPIIYAIVPITYIYVVYAFNPDKSVSEILRLSFDLGNKKWLLTFGLLIVCGLLASIVGFLLCVIGVYITQSFSYLAPYLIYKDVVGFDDEDTGFPRIEEQSSF